MCAKLCAQAAVWLHVSKGWLSDAVGHMLINSFDLMASYAQLDIDLMPGLQDSLC